MLALAAQALFAQATEGSILGTVTDSAGGLTCSSEVGDVTQTVEITGTAPLLKTATPEVATLITQEQLQNLRRASASPTRCRTALCCAEVTAPSTRRPAH